MAQSDFVSRGQDLVAAGQYQEAVKVCRLGLLARPGEVNGRLVLASALLALRRYDEVLAEMRVAIELEPGNAGAHQLRGEALLRKGDPHGAVDTLTRARKLAGGDPSIAALLEEAKLAQAAAGPPAFGEVDSMTKHYPSHRGDGASGSGRSGSFTKPIDRRRAPADDRTPSPDNLRVGDKSGTVELDPELEGVELDDDDVVEAPGGTGSMEVSDDDLVELDDDDDDGRGGRDEKTRAGRPRSSQPARSGGPVARPSPVGSSPDGAPSRDARLPNSRGAAAAVRTPSRAAPVTEPTAQWSPDEHSENATRKKALPMTARDEDAATAPRSFVDDEPPRAGRSLRPQPAQFEEESSLSGRASHPRLAELSAGPLGGLNTPAPVMTPSGRFLSTPSGPGAAIGGGGGTFSPPSGPVIVPPHAPTVAGAVPPGLAPAGTPPGLAPQLPGARPVPAAPPQAKTMVPATMAAVRPTMAMSAAELPSTSGPPGHDMDLIRAGVGPGGPEPISASGPPRPSPMMMVDPGRPPSSPRTSRMSLRSPLMLAVWITITAAIIGGGVFAGFKIREVRLAKQIATARKAADTVARSDTWAGWRGARDRLVAIGRARATRDNRAALAKTRAILAAWFDDDLDGARAAVNELGADRSRDAVLARAYLAIADGDGAAARKLLDDAAAADDDPELTLAQAYAAAADGRWEAAATAARRATEQAPRPASFVILCVAEAARQRFPDAERACGEADRLVAGHPAATIARARVRAASGEVRADADKLRGELEAVSAEAARPVADQRLGVSPGQAAWAQLALAELGLASGDPQKARVALERVKASQRSSRGLVEAQAAATLALGDVAEAGRAADQGLTRWPKSPTLVVVKGRSLLAAGDLDGAAAAVDALPAGTDSLELGILRGELAIARGDLDGATKLLDEVLTRRPDDIDALVARAEIDLLRNDPHAAQTRLEVRYSTQAPPRLTVAYAAALRQQRRWQDARVALGRATAGASGPIAGRAWLELARVERDFGDAKKAREAYGKAQEMLSSRDAQREAAVLLVDDGDAIGGRDALRKLLDTGPGDGLTMVEAARALVFTGDLDGARALLDKAADVATTPAARLARERGRVALRRRDFKTAITELRLATSEDDRDFEAWLLFLDAQLAAGDVAEAKKVQDSILLKFPNHTNLGLVNGRLALVSGRATEAVLDFKNAKSATANAPRRTIADACYWLGYTYYALGEFGLAKIQLKEAIEKESTNADAHGVLGQVQAESSEWKDASITLARAVQLDADNAEAWFYLGAVRANLRKPEEARTALETYLKRWPGGDHAEEARGLLAALR